MTAKQGQTWDMISYIAYGNEFYVKELMLANPQYHDIVIFEGGEVLEIPGLETEEENTWNLP